MKKIIALIMLLMFVLGCQSTDTRVAEGSVIGGVVGAAAGGIIGNQVGSTAVGLGIGAVTGAVAGAVIGDKIKKPQTPQAAAQMTTDDVVAMVKQGTTDSLIIDKIKSTNSKFTLSEAQIANLKQQGVSSKVIDAMLGK